MPPRVSDLFHLGLNQGSLDFLDVDLGQDNRFYIDPSAIRQLDTRWGRDCNALIQDFFDTVQGLMQANDRAGALALLGELSEPNETRLGESAGPPAGHGLGHGTLAQRFYDGLTNQNLFDLFEEFEEIALLTDGIDRDVLSDVTTNIIREPLIFYTRSMCAYYLIRPSSTVASGPMWDPRRHDWYSDYVRLPVYRGLPILLVPKVIIRRRLHFNYGEYFQHYILPFRQREELALRTELVGRRKNGTLFVTKKSIISRYGRSKTIATRVTRQHAELLDQYRAHKAAEPTQPLGHDDLGEEPNWQQLLDDVVNLRPGIEDARSYERAIQRLLTPLFYPWLVNPGRQRPINDGRRIIDLTFDNDATTGFFRWVNDSYGAPTATIECKNYTNDPGNHEVDQLAGRFSARRGWFGILVCRSVVDQARLRARCADCARDRNAYIMVLTDDDLRLLVEARRQHNYNEVFRILREQFEYLIN
jgi:hypothetical protein